MKIHHLIFEFHGTKLAHPPVYPLSRTTLVYHRLAGQIKMFGKRGIFIQDVAGHLSLRGALFENMVVSEFVKHEFNAGSHCQALLLARQHGAQGIIEFSVIHDEYRNSGMSIRPVGDCMKKPSLRGGAADAAIQKVFAGTDAALLDCHAACAARNDEAVDLACYCIHPALSSITVSSIAEES